MAIQDLICLCQAFYDKIKYLKTGNNWFSSEEMKITLNLGQETGFRQ